MDKMVGRNSKRLATIKARAKRREKLNRSAQKSKPAQIHGERARTEGGARYPTAVRPALAKKRVGVTRSP